MENGKKRVICGILAPCGFFVGTFALGQTMNFVVLRHMGQ